MSAEDVDTDEASRRGVGRFDFHVCSPGLMLWLGALRPVVRLVSWETNWIREVSYYHSGTKGSGGVILLRLY